MSAVLARVVCDDKNRPFVAGLFFVNNIVVAYAPILKHMKGWNGHQVKAHADKMGWKVDRVPHKYDVVEDITTDAPEPPAGS